MTTETTNWRALTAAERVLNGARWLNENFPGWQDRIDPETLQLNNGEQCICGQVFAEEALNDPAESITESPMGYTWAYDNLFSEANSWISAAVPKGEYDRAIRVAQYLGFMDGPLEEADWDDWVSFRDLQIEWERYLGFESSDYEGDYD